MKRFLLFWTILSIIWVAPAQERNASSSNSGANEHSPIARETHVTAAEALNVGYTFMHTCNSTKSNDVSKKAMQLIYTGRAVDSLTRAVTDCYYVFALQPKGFVIVAADERVNPILGYSYDNNFVVENMPDHVRGWLGNYEKQIQEVAKSNLQAEPATQTKWTRLKSGQAMSSAKSGGSVGPLLTTEWGQGWPWNDKCPVDENGDRCMVGCVAVALGQIMKYHSYPQKGYGYVHYTLDNNLDTITANFDTTYYDWQNMPNGFVTSGYESMAQLLADIGKSLFMQYSSGESGTFENVQTLADVFNYDYFSMQAVERSTVEDSSWISLIKNELENNRPVYYRGQSHEDPWIATAHAFVCDGYDANSMFHFNFGWGGDSDGYYNLSNISAGLWGFNHNQSILIGIQPSTGNTLSGNDTLSGSLSFNESLYCGAFSNITIMPGTELKFAPEKVLCVSGSILANGAENSPVVITAVDTTVGWGGLQIHPSMICYRMGQEPDTLRLNHTTISYSINEGVNIGWPNYFLFPATMENVVHKGVQFNNADISHNATKGIIGNFAYVKLDSCNIHHNGQGAIYVNIGAIELRNSSLHHNIGCIGFHNQSEFFDRPTLVAGNSIFMNSFAPNTTALIDMDFSSIENSFIKNNEVYRNGGIENQAYIICINSGNVISNRIFDNVCSDYYSVIFGRGSIKHNYIYGNQGSVIWADPGSEIVNNLIYNNDGGIHTSTWGMMNQKVQIYNNTIINNGYGIGHCYLGSSESNRTFLCDVRNNILWNSGTEIDAGEGPLISYNNIVKGGSASIMSTNPNSIIRNTCDKDPAFINPTTSIGPVDVPDHVSFQLTLSSPAIDNGYYDSTMTISELDLAGVPRMNRILDVGAYENQSDTVHPCFFTENNTVVSCVGLSVDMSMLYRGEQCSFAWYHNDNLIPNSDSDTLHIETVASNDEGDYYCIISNAIGIDTSSVIHLVLSPQLPGCIETINGPDTIYHFQQNIPFSINNVLNADNIEWTVSEGLSIVKTSDTSILVSVNQAIDSAFLYVVASNGCGACADTAMIHFLVLGTPPSLHLSGTDFLLTNYDYGWGPPRIKVNDSYAYDDVEWQIPSWVSTYYGDELLIINTSSFDGNNDTIYARWYIDGYGYGSWTPYPIKVLRAEDYDEIIYASIQPCGNKNGSSWTDATDLKTGITIASYLNKKLWVASGTYYGDGVSETAFPLGNIEMYGGFSGFEFPTFDLSTRDFSQNATVLDGGGVQRLFGGAEDFVIDGFVLQNAGESGFSSFSVSTGLLRNCIIRNNTAPYILPCLGVTAQNCLFYNNETPIQNWNVINSTFVNNSGYLSFENIFNSIILDVWGNYNTVCHSAFYDWNGGGEGNLLLARSNDGTSPDSNYVRFVDPENGDFHLAYGSACINAGTPDISELGLPSVDLQGLPRVLDGRIDMGAYEYYPVPMVETYDTICEGNRVTFYGTEYAAEGIYTVHTNPDPMQDTIYVLHLTVNSTDSTDLAETACGSYEWNRETFTISGDYTRTFTNANGCDSVVTLHLTVNQPTTGVDVQTACGNYTWIDGITYTESNSTATYTLTNAAGCDSVVTLNLTINSAYHTDLHVSVCDMYEWNDSIYTQSGNYTQTFTAANGCDSVVTLHLMLKYAETAEYAETACDSYTWNDSVYIQSGDYVQTFTNAVGCDSVVTLHLTINQPTTGTDVQTACGSYTWIDGITYTESNNTATYTLTNAAGCDSVVTLNLTINQPTTGTDVQTACGSYTWIDGITYTESNSTATYTLTNAAGCDSIVTLNLTINQPTTGTDVQTTCGSYTWIDGITYTESNSTATYTLTNAAGCDSVVTLNLTVNQPSTSVDVQTACGNYTWIDGVTYTESNSTATYTLANAAGCDSVVTLNLTIFPADSADFAETACEFFTWEGTTYTTSGDYTQTFTNVSGCDSVVTLHLTIQFATSAQFADTACGSYEWNGQNYTSSGDFEQTFTASNGCDSVVTLHLTINHSATSDEYLTICENELPYHYINGQIDTTFDIGTPELLSLNYYLSTENGCDSIVTLYLTVSECLPPDEDAPFITEAHISGLDMIIVTFNEAVDSASAINAGNYSFSNGMTVTSVTVDSNMVYLTVSPSVTLPDTFLLTTSNITDMAGNTMSTETIVVGPPAELICENIAQLRTKMDYTNTNALVDAPEVYRLTGSVVVTANLQIYNQKVIQDSTAAIYIFDPNNVLGNLEIGDQVRDIQGTLRNYFGYLEFIPVHTYQHFEAAFVDVEPLEISLAQLNDNSFMINHQAELIKLDSVSITSTGNFAILNRYDLLQNGVTAPALYTYFREADYIYQPIPTEMLMNLKGFVYATSKILTNYYDFRYYIVPRWENDMMILPTVPVVITSEVSDIMATSAICGGNVTYDGNDYVTARGVCWSTASNPTLDDFHTTDGSSGGAFSSTLTGLVPNTTYYVRAYATNSLGTSYGEETSFTSLCDTDIQVLTIAACGEYTWNDSTYTTSGDYMSYGIDAAGCDSVVTLHLTINHSATSDEFLTISENELPYHYVNGQIDTTFDIGTPELLSLNYYLLTESGCDSIVTLHLTITPYDTITLAVNDTLMGSVALAGALPEGATVLGNGSYRVPRGSEISVKAVFDAADFGFLFWTNGNDTLSVDSVYTFTVTGSSEYTAHIEYLPTPYFYVSKTGWATWINPHSGPGAFIRVEVKAADSDQWETLHYSSSITSAQLPLYMLIDSTLYTVRAVLHNYEPSFESREVTFDWFYVACDHFEGVSNFVGELTDQGVALSWDAGEGPQQYLLYRNYLIIDTLTTTNYFDTSGVYSNKYYVSRVFGGSAVCPYNNDSLSMSCQIAAKVYVDLTLTTDPPMFGTAAFVLPDNTGHVAIGGTCTVSATANEGYSFTHWTFNGTKVSVQSTYTFDVEQVGEVVAHFEYAPATDLYVSRTGWATWNNPHGQPGDNSCVSTQVTLKSLDGQVLFTQTFPQSSANHCQLPTSNLADSTLYLMSVVLTDTAGNSSEASIQWYYVACDHLSGFTSAAGTFSQQGVNLNWDYPSNMTFTTATVDFDFFNGFVTDTAVMSDGGDASWAVEPQSTAGPYCNYASNTWVGDRITLSDTTRIYEMEVYAFQSDFSTTSPFTGLYIQIYQGNPEDSVLVWGSADSNLMTATAFTGCYRGSASNPMMFNLRRPIMSLTASGLDIELAPGTYYLVWSTSVSNTINPVAIPHCKPVVGNTGDYGMLFTESRGWRTMHDGGSGESFGFAFHLTGEQVLSPVVEPESAAIYRDGELIDTTSATTYMDPEGSADHSYEIRVVYGGDRHCVYGNASMSMSCLQPVSLHCGETFTGDTTAVACESFSWQGITYTESGDYTYYTTTATGCDSVVILHLTIYQNEITDFTVTCQDSCYTWNDQVYCNSGDYNQTLQTVYGCDSVVTLHLTITVGVDDYEIVDFKVYPNPTNNFVNVQCTMNNVQLEEVEIQVVDIYGKLVRAVETLRATSLQRIDISDLASGVYFVKAVADGKTIAVRKVVKQ